jgi:hypothetical protein
MIPIAAVIRLVAGDWAIDDLAVAIGIVTVIGPVEWIIHLVLLHASPDAWTTRVLGTSTGHRQHHIDPPAIDFLQNHVLPLPQDSKTISIFSSVVNLNGTSLPVVADGTTVTIGGATVVTPDIEADNGFIHAIDTVLVPAA